MKTFFLLCALYSSMALAEIPTEVKPDTHFTHRLSSSGPLSKEKLLEQEAKQHTLRPRVLRLPPKVTNDAPSTAKYTYLRCYYRTNSNPTVLTTDYVWGLDSFGGDYYRISGYWRADGALEWINMFYSDVTQDTLQRVCRSTLDLNHIYRPVEMVAAADNALSFNYTVWATDDVIQNGINKIVAFGDSLSDTQNAYNASLWKLPNSNSWYLGRFSNGKTWVEYLADNLRLPLYNWAIGGAGVTTQNLVIPGAIQQVQSFTRYMRLAQNYQPQNTLFTLLIGGNDLIKYNSSVDQIISGETQALQHLIQAGARNILLLTLPDLSKAPIFKIKTNGPTVAAQVIDFNAKLHKLVGSLRAQYGASLHIQLFDTFALFNDFLDNPAQYGIGNTTDSCLNIDTISNSTYLTTQTARPQCREPDTFVFWDMLHPSTHTHRVMADAITAYVKANFGYLNTLDREFNATAW